MANDLIIEEVRKEVRYYVDMFDVVFNKWHQKIIEIRDSFDINIAHDIRQIKSKLISEFDVISRDTISVIVRDIYGELIYTKDIFDDDIKFSCIYPSIIVSIYEILEKHFKEKIQQNSLLVEEINNVGICDNGKN